MSNAVTGTAVLYNDTNDDDDTDDKDDTNDTWWTNHDSIGSLACMPNEPNPPPQNYQEATVVYHALNKVNTYQTFFEGKFLLKNFSLNWDETLLKTWDICDLL